MSLFVLRDGDQMHLMGEGYLPPEEVAKLESVSALLKQFADESQAKYGTWADEKDSAVQNELNKIRAEERAQVVSLIASATQAMKDALEQARIEETEKLRGALRESLSVHAADFLLAAALGKAAEEGLIDEQSKVMVPEYAKEKLIEHLGQLLPFEDYLFLTKVVEEQDYVTEGSAIVVTPVEAFKFDAQALVKGMLP